MSLNIKNDETYKLIQELARLTGENMTAAVTEAVRKRIERLRQKNDTSLSTRLLMLGKDCALRFKGISRSVDQTDLLP